MSHMIPAGKYKIKNFLYKDRYVYMSEHGEVVSHDIQVDVKKEDEVEHLATLYDTTTKLYLTIGKLDDKVVADKNAQKLQWSSEDGVKFEIHPENFDKITVEPAPQSEAKYWTFEKVE